MDWSFTRRRRDMRVRFVLIFSLLAMAVAPTAGAMSTSNPSSDVVAAREVRTVWTSELGLGHPAGIAHIAATGAFLVVGDDQASALVMGPDEEVLGRPDLGPLARPSTLAYDPTTGQVTSFDGRTKRAWSGPTLGMKKDPGRTSEMLTDASSATYAADGDLLLLAASGQSILRVEEGTESKIDLAGVQEAQLIASNPVDGNIYVMSADTKVTAVDPAGAIVQTFDFSGVSLVEPTGMVFAPSSDPTDAPADFNLFIADSGGTETLGGVVEVTLTVAAAAASVPVDVGTLVRSTATSLWNPGSPDPAGVAFIPDLDNLIVVDSEVDEATGAGWNNVNMWRTYRTGTVIQTGTFWGSNAATFNGKAGFSKEPTGAGYDPAAQSLFVSDDSARKVFVVKKGGDGRWGTSDDLVSAVDAAAYGSTDTEDPEFDTTTGHLFFLDGVGREIYRVNPVDGVFGNGNDVMTHFDISHLGPTDFEGLASNAARGTLLVGARSAKKIFEIQKDGTLLREISVSGISGLRYVSGLAFAPSSDDPAKMSFYIVDRQVDNGANPNENDGVMWEVRAPDSLGGGGPQNQAPVVNAGSDSSVTLPAQATLAGTADDDGLPAGSDLSVQWSVQSKPSGGVVTFGNSTSAATTATFNLAGSYVLRLSASDGALTSFDDVTIQVSATTAGGTVFKAISQATLVGSVSGTIEDTHFDDGLAQSIREVANGQGFRAKLEHTWTFQIASTDRVTFVADAYKSGSETFKFAYSTNGGSTWKNMVTILATDGLEYRYNMPSGVTGAVLVRVRDVDRTKGDTGLDTIYVDYLAFVPTN